MLRITQVIKKTAIFVFFGLVAQQVSAASVTQVDISELLQTAELVFEGEVIDSQSRFNLAGTAINTYVTVQVFDVISGDFSLSRIELSFAGGSAHNLTMQVPGMIYPQLGEKGIYFVEEVGRVFVNPIVGWSQGHFLIREDASGTERMFTAQEAPIVEMNDEAAPAATLSKGVASGIRTSETNLADRALSKSQFKQSLRDRLSSTNASDQ